MPLLTELTIAITTYNRKERLLKQLHTIFLQPKSKEVNVVIIDNHSDYDIKEAITEEFGCERASSIRIVTHPVNFGMGANLAQPFLHCYTKWLWTLSDDDETCPDALETIEQDINLYPNTMFFKYNYIVPERGPSKMPEAEICSLPSLIDYYLANRCMTGHLIFLSNNVYNMEYMLRNYGLTLSNCYCSIAQLLPVFYSLDKNEGSVKFREKCIVAFQRPDAGSSYKYLTKAVEISSTAMFDFNMSDKYHKKLGFLVTNGFSHYRLVISALIEKDRKRGKYLYNQVYSRSFKYSGSFIDKVYHALFNICYTLHINLPYDSALKFRNFVRKYFPSFR